jgi:hypothetical protein
MCSYTVQLGEDNPTFAGLAQENGFGSAKLSMLLWLVKGTAVICTRIGPGGLLLVVPPPICCPSVSFMGGVAKEYVTKLGCENIFSGSHTEQRERCSKAISKYARKFLGGYLLGIHIDLHT